MKLKQRVGNDLLYTYIRNEDLVSCTPKPSYDLDLTSAREDAKVGISLAGACGPNFGGAGSS